MYGALTYTICMYVNMGVKRSVRTSGVKPTILDILENFVSGPKIEIACFLIFPLYFLEFPLYISLYLCVMNIVTFQVEILGTCY